MKQLSLFEEKRIDHPADQLLKRPWVHNNGETFCGPCGVRLSMLRLQIIDVDPSEVWTEERCSCCGANCNGTAEE